MDDQDCNRTNDIKEIQMCIEACVCVYFNWYCSFPL